MYMKVIVLIYPDMSHTSETNVFTNAYQSNINGMEITLRLQA
jgi:hypothetical protein